MGAQARQVVNDFANVKFLIIDEYSMVGCRMLEMINMRCKEATGNYSEDFGGIFTYFFGDVKQLPPVKDSPIYSYNLRSILAKNGRRVVNNIEGANVLNTCHRQDDRFLRILDNISEGQVSKEDLKILETRMMHMQQGQEEHSFTDAIQLFSTKDELKDLNIRKLCSLRDINSNAPTPVLKIEAHNSCSKAEKATSHEAQGLEQVIYLAKGCKVMLRTNLWLKTELVNGAIGTVIDILYDKQSNISQSSFCYPM